jgi:hypothetical protein
LKSVYFKLNVYRYSIKGRLGADHLTFEGGGVILKKNFLQGHSEQQKNTCTNKLREKISCPIIWLEKKCCKTAWLQGSI